jgi:hypothetical protein
VAIWAIMSWFIWYWPMGLPNCLRSLQYLTDHVQAGLGHAHGPGGGRQAGLVEGAENDFGPVPRFAR